MNIFTIINDLITRKNEIILKKEEYEDEFNPYMSQRWISMYSDENAYLIGKTINKVYKGVIDKKQWYKLFTAIIPRGKFKRISYIKKGDKKSSMSELDEQAIKLIASNKKISEREVRMYVTEYGLNLSDIKKTLKSK